MIVALIAAVAENGTIGRDGDLPWRLPADLRHFKRLTLGKPVIMGRKTWQSLGRPLPGRRNIVVTRDAGFAADGAEIAASLDAALAMTRDVEEAMVIGGGEIYARAMARADRLYITHVHAAVEGDTHFPDIDGTEWRETAREEHAAKDGLPAYSFVSYERVSR
jgi:dihydrofolate reductase